MTRQVRYLADTGFLICFGAIAGGRKHFSTAFSGTVAASPTIRVELARKHADQLTARHVRTAIDSFVGMNHSSLLDVPFLKRDEPERNKALTYMRRGGALPTGGITAFPITIDGHLDGTPDTGKHGGEAEIVALATRHCLPLLMNDSDGTKYARARNLPVEPFAHSLKRLVGSLSLNEVYRIWKTVDAQHDTGAVVQGPAFFRQPAPSSRASRP